MQYILSKISLISLTKKSISPFNTFLSTFILLKIFCFLPYITLYTLNADKRIMYFLVLRKICDMESGLRDQMQIDVNFQVVL